LGLRRIDFVRIILGEGTPRCEAVGISHRRTVTRLIPLRSAMALVRAGVPSVVRRPGATDDGPQAEAKSMVGAGRRA
jgi:hypothetical protein